MSLLTNQTSVNQIASLFAPAGSGGGGGGPASNISSLTNLSSILFNVDGGDGVTPYALNIYGQGNPSAVFFANGGIAANPAAAIYTGIYASTLVNALSNSFVGSFFATQDPGTVTGNLVMGSILNDGNVIVATDQNRNTSALNIIANPLAVSSLVVSSINGATPGSGANPNLTVSTITVASNALFQGGINMSNTTLQLSQSSSNAGVVYYNAGNSNIYFTAPSTAVAVVGTQSNAEHLKVGTNSLNISQPVGLGGSVAITAQDPNLYSFNVVDSNATLVSGYSLGTIGGRNQMYIQSNAQIQSDLWVSSISKCAAATVSSFTVSSINGAAPGGSSLTNNAYPFTTGSDNAGTWTLTVNSNTGGNPQYLTNSVTTNASNSYLVSVDLVSGSNSDTATQSYTKLALAVSGGTDVTLGSFPGFSDFWIYNGTVGSKTAIVRGASAIRLYAWATSPTQNTTLLFDTATGMSITNLGPSS